MAEVLAGTTKSRRRPLIGDELPLVRSGQTYRDARVAIRWKSTQKLESPEFSLSGNLRPSKYGAYGLGIGHVSIDGVRNG